MKLTKKFLCRESKTGRSACTNHYTDWIIDDDEDDNRTYKFRNMM